MTSAIFLLGVIGFVAGMVTWARHDIFRAYPIMFGSWAVMMFAHFVMRAH